MKAYILSLLAEIGLYRPRSRPLTYTEMVGVTFAKNADALASSIASQNSLVKFLKNNPLPRVEINGRP